MAEETQNPQTYNGACHCGQAKFEIRLSSPISGQNVVRCNRVSLLLGSFTSEEIEGEDTILTKYLFGSSLDRGLYLPR